MTETQTDPSNADTEPAVSRASLEADRGEALAQVPLSKRVGNWKTLVSFLVAFIILGLVVTRAGYNPSELWQRLRSANWVYFLIAGLVYYATFPLRGLRWKFLLENAYRDTHEKSIADMHISGLTQIVFISWFANCVVPAKLGDLYRAYLAKLWQGISWVKTVGTVVAERIIDVLVIAVLLGASGLIAFHSQLGKVKIILGLGLFLAVLGIIALVLMKQLSPYLRRLVPNRYQERYALFEDGTLLSLRRLPLLFAITVPIWLLEGLRIQFIFMALDVKVPNVTGASFYMAMLFFALATAVLTTIPFTPGGLGIVQGGLTAAMVIVGVSRSNAAAVVIMDSLWSYWSIAIIGFLVYLLSKRSHFRNTG